MFESSRPQTPPGRGPIEGERKQVTVLFSDVVDSTSLAERMDPEEWASIINGAHQLVSEQVYRYEGQIGQLQGDGVLCFFGAPVSHEDDAERAVRAGLAIIAAVEEYARELAAQDAVENFRMRIGIHTGLAVVGNVGNERHLEYLALGDTVNLAARMQTLAEPNTVLITQNTYNLLGGLFDVQDRGELQVKGKAAPVRAYRVLAARPGAIKTRGFPGLASPMIGRVREMDALAHMTAELQMNRGGLVSIIGEAGLGKTRLLAEWYKSVVEAQEARRVNLRWAEGKCLSYGLTMAYHLIRDLLWSLLDVPLRLGTQERQARLQAILKQVLAAELYVEIYPYLAHLLQGHLEPEPALHWGDLDASARQAHYANALSVFLRCFCAASPTILICEDLHWADPASVDILRRLVPLAGELPLVICLSGRPEQDTPGWQLVTQLRELRVQAVELRLAALSDEDSNTLISNLLEFEELTSAVRQLILSKTEGNPFFVEEVIRILIDRGRIRRESGRWLAAGDIQQIEIPDTLQGVLMARIDQLPTEVQRTLQIAAVIGREFPLEILTQVLERQVVSQGPKVP